jgi:DNA-directed RNA polymerase subunit RPC12/RpoP
MQPYVCTYGGCDLFDHFFDSKEAWFTHEAQYHRAKWFCNTDSHIEYESEEAFLIHMSEDHDHNFEDAQFSLLKDVFRRPSQSNEGTCNLCLRFSKRLKSHLARHLQAIALFAIPRVNKTSGSGVAEPKSGSSKSMAKERDRTTAVSSAVSASLLDSEHRPWDQELLLMEPNSALADLDSDIDVGAAAVIPDAVDLSWDDVTDKFSRARERSFRPLNILVIVGDDQRSLERAQQLVEELHCRPVLPPSVGNIDQYNPTEDLVLIDSSYPTDLAVKLAEQFKSRSNLPSDVPQGGVPVIRVTPSGRFYEERGYFDDILPYPLDLALLEDAIGDRCQWAPAPPGWRSEAGPNSNHDGSFRILDVLICCLRPQRKEAWKLSDMLKDFRCRPTVVERVDQPIEQRDQIFETTILSIKFDIIFVDFMYDPHNVENIPRTMLSLADAGLNSMTPIVYLLGETLESNFTDGMIADARVLVEPFSHDILAETLYRLCSWTPPEDRNMQDTDAEDIPLEVENAAADPLPVPEAWLEQYLRTRFRRAPDFILNRLAQHMSALRIQIKNSRLGRESHNTWRELIKASLVIPSGVEKEVLTVCGCSNCMQQWLGGMQEGDNELCPNCGSRVIKSEYIPHLTSPEFPWPFASLPVLHTTSLSDVEIGGRALVALVLSNITPINRSGDPFLTEGQTIIISDWRTNGQLVFRDFSGNKMGHISEEHVRLLKDTETDEHDFVEATTNAEGKPENIDGGLPHLQAHRVSIQNIQFKPTDVFCPYCTSTIILPPRAMSSESIEQPDSTMESIWR